MPLEPTFDSSVLLDLVNTKMPFGKYKGHMLYQLPEYYLAWFKRKGFPKGRLGMLMETLYEIKLNDLDYLLEKIIHDKA
jgi:uncharacterized protein (DUF3820 family)